MRKQSTITNGHEFYNKDGNFLALTDERGRVILTPTSAIEQTKYDLQHKAIQRLIESPPQTYPEPQQPYFSENHPPDTEVSAIVYGTGDKAHADGTPFENKGCLARLLLLILRI